MDWIASFKIVAVPGSTSKIMIKISYILATHSHLNKWTSVWVLYVLAGPACLSVRISDRILNKLCNEIIYPFANVDGCGFEVLEWIRIFIPCLILDVITYL